jgi:Ca-activated chloride channel family protein
MGSGHNVTALYELIPAGSNEDMPVIDPLKYQVRNESDLSKSDFIEEFLNVKIRYKKPEGMKSMLMVKPVKGSVSTINNASDNLRFAAAVTEFGMILRNSEFSGNASLETAISLARSSRGEDEDGYRSELIRLINTVKDMKALTERE